MDGIRGTRSLLKDVELHLGHKPTPWKAGGVSNKKSFIFLSSLLILQLFHCFTKAFQKCPRAVEILQPLLRKPWENYSDICFHLLLFAFSPLVFLFLWPRTNFSMLTILPIPKKFHLSVRISPRSGMQRFQFNSTLLPAVSLQPCRGFVLNDASGRVPFQENRNQVLWDRGCGTLEGESSTSAKHRELQKHPRALYFFSGQTILFSVMRLYTVHSVTVVYKHSYFHT